MPSVSTNVPGFQARRSIQRNRPNIASDHIASYRPMSWQATFFLPCGWQMPYTPSQKLVSVPGWSWATKQPIRPKNQPSAMPYARQSRYGQTGTFSLRKNQIEMGTQTANPPNDESPCQNFRNSTGFERYSSGLYMSP